MGTVKWQRAEYRVLGHGWYARKSVRDGRWRLYYGPNAKGSDVPGVLKVFAGEKAGEPLSFPTLEACRQHLDTRTGGGI
jgi:hypothetical protein